MSAEQSAEETKGEMNNEVGPEGDSCTLKEEEVISVEKLKLDDDNEKDRSPPEEEEKEDQDADKRKEPELQDDYVDEEALKTEELTLTPEELSERLTKAKTHKDAGNREFADGNFKESILNYTKGLLICPLCEKELRSILYANRAAAKTKLGRRDLAIMDCTKSLEYNPTYLKALIRRAKLYEEEDKLDEALEDNKKIVELDPSNREARYACQRLPPLINERNEKLKEEMLGKLKDLGNMVLRPFGLSTENFKLEEQPGGGYSINFKK